MDFLPDIETLSTWLLHYGPIALYFFLALGIIALPIPEEALMVVSGFLMSQGKLHTGSVIIAAILGSATGITCSYLLGRWASDFFINKIGKWVGLSRKHFDRAHSWFERFGKWLLLIGYFIPGVRHFSGFSAGIAKLEFRDFALFAYLGVLLWVSTFLSIGYFFGDYCIDAFGKFSSACFKLFA